MTVKDLKEQLAGVPDEAFVCMVSEKGDNLLNDSYCVDHLVIVDDKADTESDTSITVYVIPE